MILTAQMNGEEYTNLPWIVFQIIYVDTLFSKVQQTSSLGCAQKEVSSILRGVKDYLYIEKPDTHYLIQVLKVNVNSDMSCWLYVSLVWCNNNGTLSLRSSSHNPSLIIRKTSDKFQ